MLRLRATITSGIVSTAKVTNVAVTSVTRLVTMVKLVNRPDWLIFAGDTLQVGHAKRIVERNANAISIDFGKSNWQHRSRTRNGWFRTVLKSVELRKELHYIWVKSSHWFNVLQLTQTNSLRAS